MSSKLVQLIETPTRHYIEITEPTGQVSINKITVTMEEAEQVYQELGEALGKEIQ